MLIICTLVSCENDKLQSNTNDDTMKFENIENDTEIIKTDTELTENNIIYTYEDDNIKQTLSIVYKNEYEIKFYLQNEKREPNCKQIIEGYAVNENKDLDPELDEDEDGISYPSNEFIFKKGKCLIAIRIAMKEKDKAIIKTNNCKQTCLEEESKILRIVSTDK